jgi:hypothetical protein
MTMKCALEWLHQIRGYFCSGVNPIPAHLSCRSCRSRSLMMLALETFTHLFATASKPTGFSSLILQHAKCKAAAQPIAEFWLIWRRVERRRYRDLLAGCAEVVQPKDYEPRTLSIDEPQLSPVSIVALTLGNHSSILA